jgi:hypothetical protein
VQLSQRFQIGLIKELVRLAIILFRAGTNRRSRLFNLLWPAGRSPDRSKSVAHSEMKATGKNASIQALDF